MHHYAPLDYSVTIILAVGKILFFTWNINLENWIKFDAFMKFFLVFVTQMHH